MALSQHTPDLLRGAPPMRLVPSERRPPSPVSRPKDDLADEFLFADGVLRAPTRGAPRIRPRALGRGFVAVLVVIVLLLVVRNVSAHKPGAVAAQPAPAAAHAAPAAPAAPTGIPMSIVASSLSPVSAAQSYSASVAVRNPTDVAADDVTLNITLRDGTGRAVATLTRSLGTVPSGNTVTVRIAGELDPSAGLPTGLEVRAVAARLEVHA